MKFVGGLNGINIPMMIEAFLLMVFRFYLVLIVSQIHQNIAFELVLFNFVVLNVVSEWTILI